MEHLMTRRNFCGLLGAVGAAAAPSGARITRITVSSVEGRFHKFVSMNSYDTAPKGHTYTNYLVRIRTDGGVEGIGAMAGSPSPQFLAKVKGFIGADPATVRFTPIDLALMDLKGKLAGKPCWQLIGPSVRERVEVYDGTLYFADVWFSDRGVRAVLEEAEEAAKKGYLGMKFKLGRGSKWMEREAGLARDIEVANAARKALGPKYKILCDPNNGYRDDYDRAWRLMQGVRPAGLHWMEEIFPEDVGMYTRLREDMAKAGMKVLIADGESAREVEHFLPYLKPRRLMDVLQMDIRVGGFEKNIEVARVAREAGAAVVPHNWASRIGLLAGLHVSKAVENVPAAEDDRSTCDVLQEEGYEFKGGYYTVSSRPGLGISVDEQVYAQRYKNKEVVVE